ncbi:hypothetical protein Tco_0642702 [Tanacetum coccineum]
MMKFFSDSTLNEAPEYVIYIVWRRGKRKHRIDGERVRRTSRQIPVTFDFSTLSVGEVLWRFLFRGAGVRQRGGAEGIAEVMKGSVQLRVGGIEPGPEKALVKQDKLRVDDVADTE